MKVLLQSCFFFISFFIFFNTINACFYAELDFSFSVYPENCDCLNSTITTNDTEDLRDIRNYVLSKLVQNSLNNWSNKASALKDYLISSVLSENEDRRNFAQTTIIFASLFDRYLERRPSSCALSTIINASLSCIQDCDRNPMLKELENGNYYDRYSYIVNLGHNIALIKSKCNPSLSQLGLSESVPETICYKNGTVYPINTVLNLRGSFLPEYVKNILRSLYKSNKSSDKLIASIATYSLLKTSGRIINNWNEQGLSELLYLWNAEPQPENCCVDFVPYLDELRSKMKRAYSDAAVKETEFYNNPKVCPKGDL